MAVRVYYGTCSSPAGENPKQVFITDKDIIDDENFQFKVGDLLSVYFFFPICFFHFVTITI